MPKFLALQKYLESETVGLLKYSAVTPDKD